MYSRKISGVEYICSTLSTIHRNRYYIDKEGLLRDSWYCNMRVHIENIATVIKIAAIYADTYYCKWDIVDDDITISYRKNFKDHKTIIKYTK